MTETNPILNGALWYAENLDWKIIPIHGLRPDGRCTCGETHKDPKDIAKHAAVGNWQNEASSDNATLQGWWGRNPDYNAGVMAKNSGFFVLDVDPRNGGDESFYKLVEMLDGNIPDTLTQITGLYNMRGREARGQHYLFKAPEGVQFHGDLKRAYGLEGIDIKHNGYILLYPSRHISGVSYEWREDRAPWNFEMAEPTEEMLNLLVKRGGGRTSPVNPSGRARNGDPGGLWDFVNNLEFAGGEKLDLDRFMDEGVAEGSRAVDIYRMACSLANKYGTDQIGSEGVVAAMQKFNYEKVRPPLELDELMTHVERAIDFVKNNPKQDFSRNSALGKEVGFYLANTSARVKEVVETPAAEEPDDYESDSEYEWEAPLSTVAMSLDVDALSEDEGGVPGERTMTDTGNGRRLVDSFGQTMSYTPGLGWFIWTGEYWKPDVEELGVRERAKQISAIIGAEAERLRTGDDKEAAKEAGKWARDTKSNARQSSAIESATSDPRIGVAVEDWDRDPHLFGVSNGVINLRTGALIRGAADLRITRRAPVMYQPGLMLPRFQEFLDFATYGDKEYQAWLQRAAGYTLTGLRSFDVMFLMYGPPGSGKNVLVEALVKAMGTKQYALPLPSEVLGQGDGRANQTDQYHWAEMRGKRMIWVDELPENERLKENAVKKLTGSTEITARSPGEKPFSFESQAKLWITTNHRPIISDDAMWRRIRPIPWQHVPEQADPTLKQFLHDPEGGLPAVLAWAVEGAQQIINSTEPDALGWCPVVFEAAEVYRKNEDRLGMFLEEEMVQAPDVSIDMRGMYQPYQTWSEGRGERPMSQIAFSRKLMDRGVQVIGSGSRAQVLGYTIRAVGGGMPQAKPGNVDWGRFTA